MGWEGRGGERNEGKNGEGRRQIGIREGREERKMENKGHPGCPSGISTPGPRCQSSTKQPCLPGDPGWSWSGWGCRDGTIRMGRVQTAFPRQTSGNCEGRNLKTCGTACSRCTRHRAHGRVAAAGSSPPRLTANPAKCQRLRGQKPC